MKAITKILAGLLVIITACSQPVADSWELSAPDGKLSVNIGLNPEGSLSYTMYNADRMIVGMSSLGLVFDEVNFNQGLTFAGSSTLIERQDQYTLLVGKQLDNHPIWNELQLQFKHVDGFDFYLAFRMFNDGLAFRYEIPEGRADSLKLVHETTAFNMGTSGKKWIHSYDTLAPWSPAYETFYENGLAIGTPSPWNKNGWAFPMLFEKGQDWLLITDSDLGPDYVGMHITDDPVNGLYTMRLPEEGEAEGICGSQPIISLPFQSPWRVIIASDKLADIVESNLVFHVATPSVIRDASWIKPGRASWSWWSEHDSPRDFHRLKQYIDFTAEMGWEYFLVDANWNHMQGGTLEELAKYANQKEVGLLVWFNSGAAHNVITEEPRDLMFDVDVRRAAFEKISEWGIKGVKVDFFQSDKSCIIAQYHGILQDAADFKLLANFHGSTLPRGWERTYPHLMTMEAVRGGEAYNFDRNYPDYAPWHNAILPFTRNVVGSMDYTPVSFSDVTYPHKTTYAHELALGVLFESGIQHLADKFESYLEQPDFVINYLKNMPVVWDETRFVTGYPGELVVLARRSGESWYVSGINGLTNPRDVELTLDFLPAGEFTLDLIVDGATNRSFALQTMDVTSGEAISLAMRPRGGFAGVVNRK